MKTRIGANITVEILGAYPYEDIPIHEFRETESHESLMPFVVTHETGEWYGACQRCIDYGDVTGVFPLPPRKFIIVNEGQGYHVNVDDLSRYEVCECQPVLYAQGLPEQSLVILAGFERVVAYDATGLRWKHEFPSSDDLAITECSEKLIVGTVWDAARGGEARFTIVPRTGKLKLDKK